METIECIDSVFNITYPNFQIIVVDNNSNDNSVEILKQKYPMLYIIDNKNNFGYANGNNQGIKYALQQGAKYICILNNDVIVEKNFLEPLINRFDLDKSIGIVGPCICEYLNQNLIQAMGANINLFTGLTQPKYKKKEYKNIKNNDITVDYLGGACFVVKSEVFNKIGLIPENYFLFFEETEFCLKALRNKFKLMCVSESKVYHKGSATISKFQGLSYFFLNKNRIVFMRRNANMIEKIIFFIYLNFETLGRMIIRRESLDLIKCYVEGYKCNKNAMDYDSIKKFIK